MHINYIKNNIYTTSLVFGLLIPIISVGIVFFIEKFFVLDNASYEVLNTLDFFYIIIVAPLIETAMLVGGLFVLELFLPTFLSSTLVLILFSYIHYFNHWASAIAITPFFLASILLLILWRRVNYKKAIIGVLLLHILHNSTILMVERLIQ